MLDPRALLLAGVMVSGEAVTISTSTQSNQDCLYRLDHAPFVSRQETAGDEVRVYAGGGVRWSCVRPVGTRDSVTVWRGGSDSLAQYVGRGRADFVGNAWFRDSTVELTAERATYFERDDRLEANGNVVLRNLETGSELRGPTLTYWRAVPGVRDTPELYATRRPLVEYRAAESQTPEPYLIRAERVRLKGENEAWAGGAVTIDRTDFSAKGDSTVLDLGVGRGVLIGHAEAGGADSASYKIRGRRIAFRLTDDELDWVQAQGVADATSAEWRIVGDTIEFSVAEDMIQFGQVWGDSTQSRAMSEKFTLTADSMAIDTPDQILTEVRGFGTAKATSKPDSLDTEADWMAGDTLVVRFDSTETGARAIAELIAAGHAQAFYRIYDEEDSTAAPAINYSRGLRIVAQFIGEAVDRVDVVGEADGIYLEPKKKKPR